MALDYGARVRGSLRVALLVVLHSLTRRGEPVVVEVGDGVTLCRKRLFPQQSFAMVVPRLSGSMFGFLKYEMAPKRRFVSRTGVGEGDLDRVAVPT